MENVVESIPMSLRGEISKKLIEIVLGAHGKSTISTELAKKIIYLWRQDQLTTPTGLMALFEAAVSVDTGVTFAAFDELGLHQVALAFQRTS